MYKLINDDEGNLSAIRQSIGNIHIFISIDLANTKYQEYLEWVAKGNKPEEETK